MHTACPDSRTLQRLADGELRESARSSVAEHVTTCERCAGELQKLRKVGHLVSVAIREETQGHNLSGLWEKVRAEITAPARRSRAWDTIVPLLWKPAARVAYAALLVLFIGFFAVKNFLPPPGRTQTGAVADKTTLVAGPVGQAHVDRVSTYNPEVTVSVLLAYGDKSAIVSITGLEAVEEN